MGRYAQGVSETPSATGPSRRVRQRRTIAAAIALLIVIVVIAIGAATAGAGAKSTASTTPPSDGNGSTEPPAPVRPTPEVTEAPAVVPAFNKAAFSIDDPNSIWLVVNKLRPLNPTDFVPSDLVELPGGEMRSEAAAAFNTMADAAAAAGVPIVAASAYRSFTEQTWIYHGDDETTARPGFSEHQTGLTVDIASASSPGECRIYQCFADMPEGAWLRDNAWQYGFLLRYPADKMAVTGYEFEPWHFRYIGVDLSTEMHNIGVTTLEEFFNLPAAPAYQ